MPIFFYFIFFAKPSFLWGLKQYLLPFIHTFKNSGPPQISNGTEQHSSASIFEHVDRMSRSSEVSRRVPSKIQLIAMQPIAAPPVQNQPLADRVAETNKINKEVINPFGKLPYSL